MSVVNEDAAKIVYAAMQELMPLGQDYPWVEGGNSTAQDEARRAAAKLTLLTPEHAAVIEAAKACVDAPSHLAGVALRDAVATLRELEAKT